MASIKRGLSYFKVSVVDNTFDWRHFSFVNKGNEFLLWTYQFYIILLYCISWLRFTISKELSHKIANQSKATSLLNMSLSRLAHWRRKRMTLKKSPSKESFLQGKFKLALKTPKSTICENKRNNKLLLLASFKETKSAKAEEVYIDRISTFCQHFSNSLFQSDKIDQISFFFNIKI